MSTSNMDGIVDSGNGGSAGPSHTKSPPQNALALAPAMNDDPFATSQLALPEKDYTFPAKGGVYGYVLNSAELKPDG